MSKNPPPRGRVVGLLFGAFGRVVGSFAKRQSKRLRRDRSGPPRRRLRLAALKCRLRGPPRDPLRPIPRRRYSSRARPSSPSRRASLNPFPFSRPRRRRGRRRARGPRRPGPRTAPPRASPWPPSRATASSSSGARVPGAPAPGGSGGPRSSSSISPFPRNRRAPTRTSDPRPSDPRPRDRPRDPPRDRPPRVARPSRPSRFAAAAPSSGLCAPSPRSVPSAPTSRGPPRVRPTPPQTGVPTTRPRLPRLRRRPPRLLPPPDAPEGVSGSSALLPGRAPRAPREDVRVQEGVEFRRRRPRPTLRRRVLPRRVVRRFGSIVPKAAAVRADAVPLPRAFDADSFASFASFASAAPSPRSSAARRSIALVVLLPSSGPSSRITTSPPSPPR